VTPGGARERRSGQPPAVRVRRARRSDILGLIECQRAAYATFPDAALCDERQFRLQLKAFPEGQFVALLGDRVVGYATSLVVRMDEESPWYSYSEITGNGTFSSHDPSGDTLYGADIAVHPEHRGAGIAAKLYEARNTLLRRLNLRRMVAGGRIPGYVDHAQQMSADEYVERVVAGELRDPALNAHLRAGYRVKGVHSGYIRDPQSLDYATFLELENPDYRKTQRRIAAAPRRTVQRVRICAAQYRMRPIATWQDFEQQVEFFVSVAETYHSHLLLLPELFTAQLFATLDPETPPREAIGWLADLTPSYHALFHKLARKSGLHIAAGSHPVRSFTGIRNVAHLFSPSGSLVTQEKLHITRSEHEDYGIVRGEGLRVFDTALGRIAILVCYDVEFPELARLLALAGAEILLVPYSTDERKSYLRVRYCAQARAVENTLYVALAGNVGNLPSVDNFLINYGQAAILTPSDFPFPTEAVASSAEPNEETVVISDVDIGAIEQVRELGTVRPLADRRPDFYRLEAVRAVERIRLP